MVFPRMSEIEVPLLQALQRAGGSASPRDIYSVVAASFPDLTEEDQQERMEKWPSVKVWPNKVQWARQALVDKGELDGSVRGVWTITALGIARITGGQSSQARAAPASARPAVAESFDVGRASVTLRDLHDEHVASVRRAVLSRLRDLSDTDFERFCRDFLVRLGYEDMEVTPASRDGGIDGHGNFRQGIVRLRSAFQAKRWNENAVGRVEIDKFRGAIQGQFDHGVFITTGRFTPEAKGASVKPGAATILLLDGEEVARNMVELGIGVRRWPLQMLEIEDDFFAEFG